MPDVLYSLESAVIVACLCANLAFTSHLAWVMPSTAGKLCFLIVCPQFPIGELTARFLYAIWLSSSSKQFTAAAYVLHAAIGISAYEQYVDFSQPVKLSALRPQEVRSVPQTRDARWALQLLTALFLNAICVTTFLSSLAQRHQSPWLAVLALSGIANTTTTLLKLLLHQKWTYSPRSYKHLQRRGNGECSEPVYSTMLASFSILVLSVCPKFSDSGDWVLLFIYTWLVALVGFVVIAVVWICWSIVAYLVRMSMESIFGGLDLPAEEEQHHLQCPTWPYWVLGYFSACILLVSR